MKIRFTTISRYYPGKGYFDAIEIFADDTYVGKIVKVKNKKVWMANFNVDGFDDVEYEINESNFTKLSDAKKVIQEYVDGEYQL